MSRRSLVLAAVLVVALAGGGVFTIGIVFDGDLPSTGDDSSGDDSPVPDDPGDGDDENGEADDGTEGDQGDNEEESTDDEPEGDKQERPAEDDEAEAVETADVPVEITTYDLGPPDNGAMELYNTTSEEVVATHNFTDGHETVFENLTRTTTFDLVVNVSQFPEERITFNPRLSDEVNETIGYEFRGADSYEIDWEVDDLPVNVDYDDEDAEEKAVPLDGYSALDEAGNYYSEWAPSDMAHPLQYLYLAENNESYVNGATRHSEWQESNVYRGDPGNSRDIVAMEGIGGLNDREFIQEKEVVSVHRDVVHVYNITDELTGQPLRVHVDPNTGYSVYAKTYVDQLDSPDFVRSEAEIHSHNRTDADDVIPADFPIDNIEEISE